MEAPPTQSLDTPAPQEDLDTPSLPDAVVGLPPEKRPGFWQRMDARPGGREALLAFGANLLSEPNFFAGLGKGAMAYQQTLSAERDKANPQLTKDAHHTYRRNPVTGEIDMKETAAGLHARNLAWGKLYNAYARDDLKSGRSLEGKKYGVDTTDRFKRDELSFRDRWEKDRNEARIRAAEVSGEFSERRARITSSASQGKPPTAGILKQFDEHAGKASASDGILAQGERILSLMDNGTLNLNLYNNLMAKGSQATGIGANDTTRAYAELQQFTQQLVNGILLDAKGVQTDGDAVRARIMSMVSSGDDEGARQEIINAMKMLERGRDYSTARAEDISSQFNINTQATRANTGSAPRPRPASSRSSQSGSASGVSWRIK